jgi:hypothetical protein
MNGLLIFSGAMNKKKRVERVFPLTDSQLWKNSQSFAEGFTEPTGFKINWYYQAKGNEILKKFVNLKRLNKISLICPLNNKRTKRK